MLADCLVIVTEMKQVQAQWAQPEYGDGQSYFWLKEKWKHSRTSVCTAHKPNKHKQ